MTSARWNRREFLTASLATTGWLASAACVAPFRPREQPLPLPPRVSFASGVASADPQPEAVLPNVGHLRRQLLDH